MKYTSRGLRRRRDTDKWEVTLSHKDPATGESVTTYHTVEAKNEKQAQKKRNELILELERAEASRALGAEVAKMRMADPSLKGVRTEDVKAAIISAHTGRKVSGKTVQRQERTARLVEEKLVPEWRDEAVAGNLADADIERLYLGKPAEDEL